MIKPEKLLLPPEFINDNEFYKCLNSIQNIPKFLRSGYSEEYNLWHAIISETIRRRVSEEYYNDLHQDIRIALLKDFCNFIKGIVVLDNIRFLNGQSLTRINQSILFLEDIDLPNNLIEESFILELKTKYNVNVNYLIFVKSKAYFLLDTYYEELHDENLDPYPDP